MAKFGIDKKRMRATIHFVVAIAFAMAPVCQASAKQRATDVDQSLFDDYWQKPRRGPASVPVTKPVAAPKSEAPVVVAPGAEPDFQSFAIDGKQFRLIEYKSRGGRVFRQILIGGGFVQIANDENGDGSLESWELETGGMRVMLYGPQQGKFMMMDVEKRSRQGVLLMRFARTKKGEYYLYRAEPQQTRFASGSPNDNDDFVVGCGVAEQPLQKLAAEVNQVLNSKGDNYFEEITKKSILTSSCNDTKFNKDDIAKAVAKVAKSDKSWTNTDTASNVRPASKGTLLQCLRYYQLDAHASRIGAAFAQYVKADMDSSFEKYPWKITCDANLGDLGEYNAATSSAASISLNTLAVQKKKYPNMSAVDAYAMTVFHEMLHYSLIKDEKLTHAIEDCCSKEGNENGDSCKLVEKNAGIQKRKQTIYSQLIAGMDGETYANFEKVLNEKLGDAAQLDKQAGEAAAIYEDLSKQDRCKATTGDGLSQVCQQEFKSRLTKSLDDYFGKDGNGQCATDAERKGSTSAEAVTFCKRFRDSLLDISGLDPNAMANACKGHDVQRKLKSSSASMSWWLPQAWAATNADDYLDEMCAFANADIKWDPTPAGYETPGAVGPGGVAAPQEREGSKSALPSGDTADNSGKAGAGSSVDVSNPSRGSYGDTNRGPIGREYSGSHTERAQDILRDIRRQNETVAKANTVATSILRPLIPEANARTASGSAGAAGSGSAVSRDLAGEKSVARQIAKNLPSISIPDPMIQVGSAPARLVASLGAGLGARAGAVNGAAGAGPAAVAGGKSTAKGAAGAGAGTAANLASGAGGRTPAQIKKEQEDKRAEEKALKSLLIFLQRSYKVVKPELARPSVNESMLKYSVQAVDDEGRVHGSGFPKHKLIYSTNLNRLVLSNEKKTPK